MSALTLKLDSSPLTAQVERLIEALPLPAFEGVAHSACDLFLRLVERGSLDVSEAGCGATPGTRNGVIRLRIDGLDEFVAATCRAARRDGVQGVASVVESWSRKLDSTAGATPA